MDEREDETCELSPQEFEKALKSRVDELSRRYSRGEPLFRKDEHHGIPSFLISASPSPVGAIRELHIPGHTAAMVLALD